MRNALIAILFVALTSNVSATIYTVSTNPSYPAQYTTITAAVAAASSGDTIYAYPGGFENNLVISKKIVLIGSGIDPRRPSHTVSSMQTFTLNGSAAGSSIMGFYFWYGNCQVTVDNVFISECQFGNAGGGCMIVNASNIIVENCIFLTGDLIISGGNNHIIQNSVFNYAINLFSGSNAIIRNNVFASNDANRGAFGGGANGPSLQILNNIFYKNNPSGGSNVSACTFIKNIYYLTNNPPPANATSSGNLNADPLFVNYPANGAEFSFQYNYRLQANSPGINYGTDGKDVGMWGGVVPINAGFEPPIPRIYDLTSTNSSVPVGGTLQLTIKATKAQ